ncbi:MAG: hypothetical protein ACRKGH_09380 [Dehalogenimonas sp.]
MERYLEGIRYSSTEKTYGICGRSRYNTAADFLNKLLNNNVPEYFYLETEDSLGISEPYVAFLKLPISLKMESYDTYLKAKVAQLTQVFRAKLGWLTGNIYSRVATEDWVPTVVDQPLFEERIERTLRDNSFWADDNVMIVFKREVQKLIAANGGSYSPTRDDIEQLIKKCESLVDNQVDSNISSLSEQISTIMAITDTGEKGRLLTRLKNNATVRALISKKAV